MSDDRSVTVPGDTKRRSTPIFVTMPGPPSREYVEDIDPFGRPGELHQAESAEAASHWHRANWRRS